MKIAAVVSFSTASVLAIMTIAGPVRASVREPDTILRSASVSTQQLPQFQEDQPEVGLISFDVEFEMGPGREGLLIVGGGESETFALYVRQGRAVWSYQGIFQRSADSIISARLPAGLVRLRFEFDPEQSAEFGRHRMGSFFVNGEFAGRIGEMECSPSACLRGSTAEENAGPQIEDLIPEFTFTGEVTKVATNQGAGR